MKTTRQGNWSKNPGLLRWNLTTLQSADVAGFCECLIMPQLVCQSLNTKHYLMMPAASDRRTWHPQIRCWCVSLKKKKNYHINCFFWSSSIHRMITLNYSVAFSCGAPHWLLKELRSSKTNEKSFGSGVMDHLHSHIYMYFIKIHLLQWSEPQLWLMLALLQLLLCQTILTLSWVEWSWFMIYSDALVVLPGAKFAQSMFCFFFLICFQDAIS